MTYLFISLFFLGLNDYLTAQILRTQLRGKFGRIFRGLFRQGRKSN